MGSLFSDLLLGITKTLNIWILARASGSALRVVMEGTYIRVDRFDLVN